MHALIRRTKQEFYFFGFNILLLFVVQYNLMSFGYLNSQVGLQAWRLGLFYGTPRSDLQVISKRRKMTPLEI